MTIEARIAHVEIATVRLAGPDARPAPRDLLAPAMADGRVPLELAALYQASDGLIGADAEVWDLADTLDYAGRAAIDSEYPGGAAFGWNRSDVVFVIDAADTMHAGAGAILAVDGLYVGPESAVLCAPGLGAFVEILAAGGTPWRAPRLIDLQAAQLAELIARRPDRVDARAPLPPEDCAAVLAAQGLVAGAELVAYLGIADGLRFARTGLQIAGAAGLAAVAGTAGQSGAQWGAPGAIRIGRVPGGPDLVVTAPGWLRPSDLVLQQTAGADLRAAPSFGRLLPVLNGWITSEAANAP